MSMVMNRLKDNIEQVKKQAQDAKLVAVTKYVDADMMRNLYEAGVHRMAENRSQALLEKQEALADIKDDIEWHFVGRLQRRPVKDIINRIDYLHSLDRMSLAKEVNKRAEKTIKCFLQVNISGEEQKAGFEAGEVLEAVDEIADYPKIEICGLMTMAPYEANEDELNHIFSTLKELKEEVEAQGLAHAPCHELSMGMSRDYHLAVEHGASYIRVGSALFEGIDH